MDIVKRASEELGRMVSNEEAAEYACKKVSLSVKSTSWAVYKSNHLRSIESPDERRRVRNIYKEWDKRPGKPKKLRKPTSRQKGIDPKTLELLFTELRNDDKYLHGRRAIAWMKVCYLTGARPIEAGGARIVTINGKRMCRLKNAKQIQSTDLASSSLVLDQQGRNHAAFRNVPIHQLQSHDMDVIQIGIAQVSKAVDKGIYEKFYDAVRATVSRAAANLELPSPRPSLYTMRHAFKDRWMSSLRAHGLTEDQRELLIAVLMGHGSRRTQYAYGMDSFDTEPLETIPEILQNLSPQVKVLLKLMTSTIQ